jgi:2-oxopent-4-enoate/cis-2-oxohex-4-enoate hydratase
MMEEPLLQRLGEELYEAWKGCRVVEPLSQRHPELTIEEAYRIQQHFIRQRLAAGERVVGKKIGVTSKAVMNMLGVYQPDFGYLLDGMVYNEGEAIRLCNLFSVNFRGVGHDAGVTG